MVRACSRTVVRSASRVQAAPLPQRGPNLPDRRSGRDPRPSRYRMSCIGLARPCHRPPPAARGTTIASPSVRAARADRWDRRRRSRRDPAWAWRAGQMVLEHALEVVDHLRHPGMAWPPTSAAGVRGVAACPPGCRPDPQAPTRLRMEPAYPPGRRRQVNTRRCPSHSRNICVEL